MERVCHVVKSVANKGTYHKVKENEFVNVGICVVRVAHTQRATNQQEMVYTTKEYFRRKDAGKERSRTRFATPISICEPTYPNVKLGLTTNKPKGNYFPPCKRGCMFQSQNKNYRHIFTMLSDTITVDTTK
jgi:hypothetical protein